MKLTSILFFCAVFTLLAENTHSQNAKVSINKENSTLLDILDEIEKQTEYLFLYNKKNVDVNRTASVRVINQPVSRILDAVLEGTNVNYEMVGNHILLSDRKNATNETILSPQQAKKTVTGTIVDDKGDPVIGANIIESGTANGVTTDIDGNFVLSVSDNATLQISYIGYLSQSITVGNQSQLSIVLREDSQSLDEVIVVGYGTQRKLTSTAAVGSVSADQLTKTTVVNTSKALTGLTAGITVIDRGGAPGSDDPNIYIRGVGTTGSYAPLVLVDGVQMSLSMVPSSEVESISVLKDAASASIYGSRAAHGVILVTTKRGKAGKPIVTYNGYVGIQDLAKVPEQVSAREYMDMVNESAENVGATELYPKDIYDRVLSGNDPMYSYHNWVREVYQPASITEHTLSISGGSESIRYSSMFNYMDQPGVVKNTNYKRYTYSANMDIDISKYVRFGSTFSYRHADRAWPTGLGDAQYRAWSFVPTTPSRWEDGSYRLDDQGTNPIASGDPNVSGEQIYQRDNFTGQAKIEIEPIEGLVFTGQASLNGRWDREKTHNRNYKFYKADGSFDREWRSPNSVRDDRNNRYQLQLRFLADYSKTFAGVHSFHVLLGAEQESYRNYFSRAERRNLISDVMPDIDLGSAASQFANGGPEAWGINSFFGRINYGYKDRYLFEANIRADGSSKFARGNKWGVFPSFSAAWRISEESFMKDQTWLSNLKLRASWGQTGNESIPNNVGKFLYMPQYGTENNVIMDGALVTGIYQSKMATFDLTWEKVESTNIGLDFGFLDNSLYGEFDYYIKDTKDILLNLGIPRFIGLDAPYRNVGAVRNSGVEVMLGYRKSDGDFKYSITGNFSYNHNEWIDRQGDNNNTHDYNIEREGEELGSYYMYAADGLIANQAELDEYKAKYKSDPRGITVLQPGDVKLIDTDGNGEINAADRQIFSSTVPNFIYGLTFNAEYKGFDLSLQFQGTAKANKFIYGEVMEGPAYEAFTGLHYRERWTEKNQDPNALVPRMEAANNRNNSTTNSFFLKDVSYVRLKNASIGYTIPGSITSRMNIQNFRVYLSGSNLLTFDSLFQSMDPENPDGRLTNFPPIKIVSLGVNLTF
ncbi:MAG: TonB-dependent receptor [Tannerellaceae bacterium]|jgi:TonB-linked SusC/RagA family outer membrane protein|nr:TonB-dependent receptor [Tannerellaceae bacterium]